MQTDMHTGNHADRHADRHAHSAVMQTGKQTDSHGNQAAQATAVACMGMHACIVHIAMFAQSMSSTIIQKQPSQ